MNVHTDLPRLLDSRLNQHAYCWDEASLKGTTAPPVIAMFNVEMIGHVNPTFAFVQELVKRGCKVHYFLPPNESFRAAAQEAGATVEAYQAGDPIDFKLDKCGDFGDCLDNMDELAVWPLASTLVTGEYITSRCRELGVSIVAYDPMCPHGLFVARQLGLPSVSLVTFPGMGGIADLFADKAQLARWAELRKPLSQAILDRFGVDLQGDMVSRVQWLSEFDNFVTTSEDLVAPLPSLGAVPWADEVRSNFQFAPVGCMATSAAPHVTGAAKKQKAAEGACSNVGASLPVELLKEAVGRGVKIVYVALGTMAVKDRWALDVGSASAGNIPPGTTGKCFCQHVWRSLIAAMRELGNGFHCVLSVGTQEDALDFLEAETDERRLANLPKNISVCSFVQQMEMLSCYANVFLSHAGFNSMQESLLAGVPLIAVPQAIDQPANARKIEESGWGKAFLQPMTSVEPATLADAIREVTENHWYREAVAAVSGHLRNGEVRAADRLLEMVSTHRVPPVP